jgi:hypothetical protein
MIRARILLCFALSACSHGSQRLDPQVGPCSGVPLRCPPCANHEDRGPISGPEAVAMAEEFVRNNGYTTARPLPADKLSLESIERVPSRDDLAAARYDSIQPKAFGYGREGRGWMVAFCFKVPDDEAGRAVTMYDDGAGIRMEHKDARLAAVDIRLRTCRE